MSLSMKTRLGRMGACRSDLAINGIDLARAKPDGLRRLAREQIDYFQCMLGYDARPSEVVGLLKRLLRR